MIHILKRLSLGMLSLLVFASVSAWVLPAAPASAAVAPGCNGSSSFLGLPTWYRYLDIGRKEVYDDDNNVIAVDECAIIGPSDGDGGIDWGAASGRIGLAVIEIMLRLAAIVALGFVIYGGFRYITSQGEPDSAKSARQTITNSLIGLVISLVATGAVAFIANQFTS